MDRRAETVWINSLVDDFPGLRPEYDSHVEYFGELLPHVFFGDVVRWIEALYEAHDRDTIKAFLARLERDYPRLDAQSCNVIDVSFAEDLPYPGTRGAEMALWLGPNLRREYVRGHHLRNWNPELDTAFPRARRRTWREPAAFLVRAWQCTRFGRRG